MSDVVLHRFARWMAVFLATLASVLFSGVFPCSTLAQAGGPATHLSVAPPTGSIAPATRSVVPRTGSIAPPTSASGASVTRAPGRPHSGSGNRPPFNGAPGIAYYPYFYPIAVAYGDEATGSQPTDQPQDSAADNDENDAQRGLDWSGPAENGYSGTLYNGPMRPYNSEEQEAALTQAGADPPEDAPPAHTTLVFKDGHELDVENYAIVGQTLYDLTPGHARKIELGSLDLIATEKQNDDHGVVFQVPPALLGN